MGSCNYIHYGSDEFIPEAVFPPHNSGWQTKPEGGLWASREGDKFGWKWFCEDSHYEVRSIHHSFRFHLIPETRVLTLTDPKQLILLPKIHPWEPKDYSEMLNFPEGEVPGVDQLNRWFTQNPCYLDFEKLSEEYDALELLNSGAFSDSLVQWDCNCIVVFRPEVVEVV